MENKNYQNRLRNWIGLLGMLLPVASLVCNLLFGSSYNPAGVLTSISATHYSAAYILFEGLVFGTGLFLLCYEGYDIKDRVGTIIAGAGAVTLTLFPCALSGAVNRNFLMLPMEVTNVLHFVGAFSFFGALFFIIFFQFPKTAEKEIKKGSKKYWRNILYKMCGALMVLALAWGFLGSAFIGGYSVYAGEWMALWFFGIAWLTKGGLILKDK